MREIINKNHTDMCRFDGRDDDGYQKFLGALKGYLSSIVLDTQRMEQNEISLEDTSETSRKAKKSDEQAAHYGK